MFRLNLTVHIGEDFAKIERVLRRYKLPDLTEDEKPGNYTTAQCLFPQAWSRVGWLWIRDTYQTNPEWLGIVAHEMYHVASEVFRSIGHSELCEHNEEAVAYYVKFLVRSFHVKSGSWKKKKLKGFRS